MFSRYLALLLCALSISIATLVFATDQLLTTQALQQQLQDSKLILIDMSDETQYQRFHLPGAISLPYSVLVMQQHDISVPIPQEKLFALLGTMGINQNSYVVMYDDMGGLNAARLYWELEQVGHPHLALLDGGLVKWILEARPVTNLPATPHATTYKAQNTGRRFLADLHDVSPTSRSKKVILLDVRSEDEYRGDSRYPRTGHIPGAKWWEWDQAVEFNKGFVQRDAATLRDSLAKLGLTDTNQPIITYCHSSHRATQAYYTLKRLGFTQVKIYGGSILEYQQHKELPLNLGMTP